MTKSPRRISLVGVYIAFGGLALTLALGAFGVWYCVESHGLLHRR